MKQTEPNSLESTSMIMDQDKLDTTRPDFSPFNVDPNHRRVRSELAPWVVLKFGGRSVSTVETWRTIARLIQDRLNERLRPVIVHSALVGVSNALVALIEQAVQGGETELLLKQIRDQHLTLADQLGVDSTLLENRFDLLKHTIDGIRLVGEASPRVQARVLANGELAATELGAAYLRSTGLKVVWRDVRELLESQSTSDQTERSQYLSARCNYAPDRQLQEQLSAVHGVVLLQGFIARNSNKETVLLGRGGSDTSAAYLAAKLEACRLEIWTDAPGFFSADPKSVSNARLIKQLTYQEAQEIASAGGGILHPRSISPVRESGIPLHLKCTANPEWEGSTITHVCAEARSHLKAVSHRDGLTLISLDALEMWHQIGFLSDAFECFRRHGISVDLVSTSESNLTVSVDVAANVTNRAAIESLTQDLAKICRVTMIEGCSAVTLIGRGLRTLWQELSPVLEVFRHQRVHLITQGANDLTMTFVVDGGKARPLIQQLHDLLAVRFQGPVFGETWDQLNLRKSMSEGNSQSAPRIEMSRPVLAPHSCQRETV